MPTTWKRSPEEFHKIYVANTEAFYKAAGRALAQQRDFGVSAPMPRMYGIEASYRF